MAPRFSLQPVLDYRHTRVETLEVELGQLIQEREKALNFLESLRGRRRSHLDDLRKEQSGEINLSTLNQLKANLKATEERILKAQHLLREIDKAVSAKRQETISAKQDEEALNILRNKEVERFQIEQKSSEDRQQDDIYITQAFQHIHQSKP